MFREQEYQGDNPGVSVVRELVHQLLHGHAYARFGYENRESVGSITRQDMLDFIEREYVPERIALVAVGDVDPDRVVAAANEAFGWVPHRPAPQREPVPLGGPVERQPPRVVRDLEETYLVLGWRSPSVNEGDRYAVDMVAALLGAGRSCRFERGIVRERGLAGEQKLPRSFRKVRRMMKSLRTD